MYVTNMGQPGPTIGIGCPNGCNQHLKYNPAHKSPPVYSPTRHPTPSPPVTGGIMCSLTPLLSAGPLCASRDTDLMDRALAGPKNRA